MNILIKNGTILTMAGSEAEIITGDLGVEGDSISFIGDPVPAFRADKVINAEGRIVLPGLVNAHTHTAMSLFRHTADDLPFWEWLHDRIFPLEEALTAEYAYWGSLLSIAEMIRSGTTTFADMYFFMDKTAEAVLSSGVRANLSRGLLTEERGAYTKLEEGADLYRNWHGKGDSRINVDLGPHAPYTCSPEYLKQVAKTAKELKANIHIHLSESLKELETIREQYGLSPVEYLDRAGIFDGNTLAAHCVHLSDSDMEILKHKGVNVLNNPGSNLKLGNGFAPVKQFFKEGINVCLGTDGPASNNNLNMFEEISLAALINKGITGDPTAVPAFQALKMATINGAKALGREHETGSIEQGKKADIILVDTEKPHFYPKGDPFASLVYSAQASDVCTVICNGKVLMEDNRLLTIDEKKLLTKVSEIGRRLREDTASQ